ncbi:MAG: hypothetical protein ABIA93_07965 [Candidatus Woesearchaeota archaeon]
MTNMHLKHKRFTEDMTDLVVSKEKLDRVLEVMNDFVEDLESRKTLEIAKQRIDEMRKDPSASVSEKEVDDYLRSRCVDVD